jgi:hypothetical protein
MMEDLPHWIVDNVPLSSKNAIGLWPVATMRPTMDPVTGNEIQLP